LEIWDEDTRDAQVVLPQSYKGLGHSILMLLLN